MIFAPSNKARVFDYANLSPKLGCRWRWKKENRHGRDMDKTEKRKETTRSSDQETLSPGESVDLFGNALDFAESLSCGSSQFTRH